MSPRTRTSRTAPKTRAATLPKANSKKPPKSQPKHATNRDSNREEAGEGEDERASDALDGNEAIEGSKFFAESQTPKKTRSSPKKRKVDEDEGEYADSPRETRETGKKVYDSDALDDSDFGTASARSKSKSKRNARASTAKTPSPRKKRKVAEEESEDEYEDDLKEGQEIVGVVVQAPKAGRVPPGQISHNTLDFLNKLKDPECNDRQWFKLHEPVYRVAEKEWKDFVETFTDILTEIDPQIPHLPPKDVIHRIYRDMRFSNDKTPYKKGLSASFSRSGRKGIFAGCKFSFLSRPNLPTFYLPTLNLDHIAVKPGNESIIAAGSWCPGRNEIATIRSNIQRNSRRLRNIISAPEFVQFFGKAERHPKGERQNIFGSEDELKVAPKGVEKDHKDIDLLKCRSFAVAYRFTDDEVLSPDFKEKLAAVAKVMQPFVHCLNDLMTIANGDDDDDEEEDEEEDGDAKGDE